MIPAMLFPILYGFALVELLGLDIISTKQLVGFSGSPLMYAVMLAPSVVTVVLMTTVSIRAIRYLKRFRQLGGMLCFVCDYELVEGQARCPECGAAWEPDRLGKKWQRHFD